MLEGMPVDVLGSESLAWKGVPGMEMICGGEALVDGFEEGEGGAEGIEDTNVASREGVSLFSC